MEGRTIRLYLLIGCILFALAVAAGAVVGAQQPSNRSILLVSLSSLLIFPVLIRILQRRFDIFEPLPLACGALLVMFVGRPVADLLYDQTVHKGYDIMATFDQALFVAFLGCLAFLIGYAVPFGKTVGRKLPSLGSSWNSDLVIPYAIFLFVLGIGLYSMFILKSGGLDTLTGLLDGQRVGQDNLFRGSTGYLYQAILFTIPAALLLIGTASLRGWKGLYVAAAAMLLPLVLLGAARGSRFNLLLLVSSSVIFIFLAKGKRPGRLSTMVSTYLGLTVLVGFLGDSRNAAGRDDSRMTILWEAVKHPQFAIERLLNGGDAEMFDTLANMLTVIPNDFPYQHGAVLTDLAIRVIPRPLWPDKPMEANDQFVAYMWSEQYQVARAGSASSFIGHLYQDSGLWTVFLGMFALGAILKATWVWREKWSGHLSVQLVYATVLPITLVLLRGTLTFAAVNAAFIIMPLALGLWVARKSGLVPSSRPVAIPRQSRVMFAEPKREGLPHVRN
jgi:hypothetical protein